jgi:hypothetical protein
LTTPRREAGDAIDALGGALPWGLGALHAVVSADLYEDLHELLVNQIDRAQSLIRGVDDPPRIHFCDQLIKELIGLAQDLSTSHVRAVETVGNSEQPFCLYLRNFALEHSDFLLWREEPRIDRFQFLRIYRIAAEHVLGTIVRACGPALPVVGIQNLWAARDPAGRRKESPEWSARMVSVDLDNWHEPVERLIDGGTVVVLHVDALTEGVQWEMERIIAGGLTSKTLVVSTRQVRRFGDNERTLNGIAAAVNAGKSSASQIVDFQDVLGDLAQNFPHVALCGDLDIDLERVFEAMTNFLGVAERKVSTGPRPTSGSISAVSLASLLPRRLRLWAELCAGACGTVLDYALTDDCEHPRRLAAASSQGLIGYAMLASDHARTAVGLAVLAGVEHLPDLRDEARRLDGRRRGELADENLACARDYAALAGAPGLVDVWHARTQAALSKRP